MNTHERIRAKHDEAERFFKLREGLEIAMKKGSYLKLVTIDKKVIYGTIHGIHQNGVVTIGIVFGKDRSIRPTSIAETILSFEVLIERMNWERFDKCCWDYELRRKVGAIENMLPLREHFEITNKGEIK